MRVTPLGREYAGVFLAKEGILFPVNIMTVFTIRLVDEFEVMNRLVTLAFTEDGRMRLAFSSSAKVESSETKE